jgi:GlpG protein
MKALKKIQYNSPVVLTFALISLAGLFINELTKGYSNELCFRFTVPLLRTPLHTRAFSLCFRAWNFRTTLRHAAAACNRASFEEKYRSKALLLAIAVTAFISAPPQWIFFPGTRYWVPAV